MLDQITNKLKELRDAIQSGSYADVVRKTADLLVLSGNFVNQAFDLFSSLVVPVRHSGTDVSTAYANCTDEQCAECETLCNELKQECTAKHAWQSGAETTTGENEKSTDVNEKSTDEKKLDPATIMLIIQLVGMGLELIKKWRERRNK